MVSPGLVILKGEVNQTAPNSEFLNPIQEEQPLTKAFGPEVLEQHSRPCVQAASIALVDRTFHHREVESTVSEPAFL